jgi:hypothetical protein
VALVRESVARLLAVLAVLAATVALGTWWASLLLIRAAGNLSAPSRSDIGQQVAKQLDHLAPGTTKLQGVEADIHTALHDPAVTQALATSTAKGSTALSAELARLDKRLGSVLSGGNLLSGATLVDAGRHDLAELAVRLRQAARIAVLVAAAAAAAALLVSPLRWLVLRHLALSATLVGGLALLVSWALPELVARSTHGEVRSAARAVLSGGAPVRSVVLACLIAGAAAYIGTHLFELVPGRRVAYDPSSPVPRGKIV